MKNERKIIATVLAMGIALMMLIPAGVVMGGSSALKASVEQPGPYGAAAAGGGNSEINTIVIQPNATEGKDTYIYSIPDDQKHNFGAQDLLFVGKYNGDIRTLIQFPTDTANAEIRSATLSIYCEDVVGDPLGVNVSAHLLIEPWSEGNATNYVTDASYLDSNWINRTTGVPWGAPGGAYTTSIISYTVMSQGGSWYTLNITEAVKAWKSGSVPNYGLILTAEPVNSSSDTYAVLTSSDNTLNPAHRPKLTISYGAEIEPTVPSITTNEDTPVDVDLSGRAHGTVEHVSAAGDAGDNGLPFWNSTHECRYQALYTSEEVGAEGKIVRISVNRSKDWGAFSSNFSNVVIRMAHTDLTSLTNTFDNNYNGNLIEVFKAGNLMMTSPDNNSWFSFDLNGNFTYDSAHNLLIDIQWKGDGGKFVGLESHDTYPDLRRLWNITDMTSSTGTTDDGYPVHSIPVMRFSVDVQKNGVLDKGTVPNFWPFAPNDESSIHQQMLWNHTDIGESGSINKIYLQAASSSGWAVVENLSIRMAHSSNESLGTVFEANHIDPWVEVINSTSYNVSTSGRPEWIEFDLQRPFVYNGNDNIVLDVRWRGGYGNRVYLAVNLSVDYAGQMAIANYSATSGNSWNRAYNVRFGFADSPVFTWSATSSNTSLFTASISDNMLHISPVENAYGSGTVELTLHNGAYSTTQSISVTINPVNDAPVISGLSTISCTEDIPYQLDMSPYLSDVDDPVANLTISTNSTYATVNGTVITLLYPAGVTGENINITVEDPGHLTASAELQVTVTQVNDPPRFINFVDTLTCDATVPTNYTVSPEDEETVDGNFTIFTSSAYATVSGDVITFLYPKGVGRQTVQIYLLDEEMYGTQNNISYTLNVSIIDHPEVTGMSSDANHITISFDMDMNMSSVESAFSMARNGSSVSGTFVWTNARTFTFTPSSAVNGTYDIIVGTGAKATNGAAMLSVYSGNYTAPSGLDSDGDGMPDSWELANGFDPMDISDAATDADHDGLSNLLEYETGTEPRNNDTDGDGIVDGFDEQPLTPNESAGTNPESSSFDPMMILVIILLIVVAILAVMLAKKGGKGPETQSQQGAYPPQEGYAAPQEGMQQAPESQQPQEFGEQPQAPPAEPAEPTPAQEETDIGEELVNDL